MDIFIYVFGRYFGHFALQMDISIYGFGRYNSENLISQNGNWLKKEDIELRK